MLPCLSCAYRAEIPGDAHSRCVFDWKSHPEPFLALLEEARITERTARWFRFPFNFDPVWGPDHCPHQASQRDPAKIAPPDPWADLMSL